MNSRTGRQALSLAAINGFLVVAFGAFGAHGLEDKVSAEMLDTFNTGVQYHMFHVIGFAAVAILCVFNESPRLRYCSWLFAAGIFLFSGSLYVLAITGLRFLGMITPLGGVVFLAAWCLLFVEAIRADD